MDKITYLEERAQRILNSIYDTEYELAYHEIVEMGEIARNSIVNKDPMIAINGQLVPFSKVVTETIKAKKEGLPKLKAEHKFIMEFIDKLKKENAPTA